MKPDTLSMRIKKAWPTVLQPLLLLLAVLVGVGSFVLVASGKSKSTKTPEGPPPSILMVGDSLSVGKFGEVVQGHLAQKYPVAAYASCGSSPEHWISGEPDFVTKCGYRQHTSESNVFRDFVNGRHPRPTLTPKLAALTIPFGVRMGGSAFGVSCPEICADPRRDAGDPGWIP